jgi:hypothetical protein
VEGLHEGLLKETMHSQLSEGANPEKINDVASIVESLVGKPL